MHSFVHSAALFRVAFSCLTSRKHEARHTLDFIGRNALFEVVVIDCLIPHVQRAQENVRISFTDAYYTKFPAG